MEQKFYICKHCGNIVAFVKSSGVPVVCCGEKMQELIPGTSDGAVEKHVPTFVVLGNRVIVTVGEVQHPMNDEHHIEWISLQTKFGNQRKCLNPNGEPKAEFALLDGDVVQAVFAYFNLHGLWKK